ncbi:DNA-binding transcriptional LysR family regulator [Martelella mangrovi]|uniref:DNA-binding transcriptional LysR family regulator n=2 Tax=Martelella mangrovi TaxID=1397477 RepID=A0ABV2ICX0_9HYPH
MSTIMAIPMDNLGALNVFVQAAETRSFTHAGRQLGVSPSAVGKAVARLEARLGVRLFHRSTRAITLTPEGQLFLERCRRIFCEVEAAEMELAETRDRPGGVLRVSLPLVAMLMMPTISAFMAAWPDIELELDFTDRLVDVIEEGYDVVIRSGEPDDSRLMARKLGTFGYRLVAAPAYLAAHGIPETPDDLRHHKCLRHRYPSTGKLEEWQFTRTAGTGVSGLPQTVVASAIEPLLYLALQGRGIACLSDFAVRSHCDDGTLVSILEADVQNTGSLRILWPSSRYRSPKLRVFVDFMVENLFARAQS